jgi:hypothetical protein
LRGEALLNRISAEAGDDIVIPLEGRSYKPQNAKKSTGFATYFAPARSRVRRGATEKLLATRQLFRNWGRRDAL